MFTYYGSDIIKRADDDYYRLPKDKYRCQFHVHDIFCQTNTNMCHWHKDSIMSSLSQTKEQTCITTCYITEYLRYFENIHEACLPLYKQSFFQ
jgi:hypothetical protein